MDTFCKLYGCNWFGVVCLGLRVKPKPNQTMVLIELFDSSVHCLLNLGMCGVGRRGKC